MTTQYARAIATLKPRSNAPALPIVTNPNAPADLSTLISQGSGVWSVIVYRPTGKSVSRAARAAAAAIRETSGSPKLAFEVELEKTVPYDGFTAYYYTGTITPREAN